MSESATDGRTTIYAGQDVEGWNLRKVWRDYWRVPVVALLAGLLAYLGSFVVAPQYQATARVLIRGQNSTVLNSNGTDLAARGGVIDSQLAISLSDTQAALVSNRAVAEQIVDELDLDREEEQGSGPIAKLKRGVAGMYVRTRAYLTSGFYKERSRREVAIQTVAQGLMAKQVHNGYALDITGTWTTGEDAAAIANRAAELLVETANNRFREESATYRDHLEKQVDTAIAAEEKSRQALADFKAANGIVTTPEQDATGGLQASDTIRAQISAAEAELSANQAQVRSLESQLAATPPTTDSSQEITTGRSQTNVEQRSPNPVYQTLLSQLQQARASVASVSARLGALRSALESAGASPTVVSQQEKDLDKLQLDLTIASETRQQLAQDLQTATVNAQRPQIELTAVASAAAPTYPVAPKRYLFLGVGFLLGALIGFVWSYLRVQRRERLLTPASANGAAGRDLGEVHDLDLPAAEQVERAGAAVPTTGENDPFA
jgi:uncharacterized protein involved in exopolysaccharide biosynthesis